jgi:hypothetical protein
MYNIQIELYIHMLKDTVMKKKFFSLLVLSVFARNSHTAEMPHQAQIVVHQQEAANPVLTLMALHLLLAINQEREQTLEEGVTTYKKPKHKKNCHF